MGLNYPEIMLPNWNVTGFDVETTGASHNKNSMISGAGINLLNPDNSVNLEFTIWPDVIIDQAALNVNGRTFENCMPNPKFPTPDPGVRRHIVP